MTETATLGWLDYTVIFIMLSISIGIGIYYRFSGGRQKTVEVIKNISVKNLLRLRLSNRNNEILYFHS